jgi:hypothetical protein
MTDNRVEGVTVLQRHHVTLERLATWLGFAGAVGLQAAVLLFCYRAIYDALGIGALILPAVIAAAGLALIGAGRFAARRSRRPSSVHRRMGDRILDPVPELHGEAQRSAA